jgi:tetratricopeptide (TPR) repeat protein
MKSRTFFFLTAGVFIFSSAALPAAPDNRRAPFEQTLKNMELNRVLIVQLERELETLPEKSSVKTSNLRLMVQSLKEDQARLSALLPVPLQAEELAKDLTAKKTVPATPARTAQHPKHTLPAKLEPQEKALKLIAEERFDEAASIYEEIILKNPEDDEAYALLGHTRLLSGEYDKAERAFRQAVDIHPKNLADTLSFYEEFALENPGDDEVRAMLGYVYLFFGQPSKAETVFKESLSINPRNEPALEGLLIIRRQIHPDLTAGA